MAHCFCNTSIAINRRQSIISHDMGFLLKEQFVIGVIFKVFISCSGDFCFSTLIISILMESSSFWYLRLASVSNLRLFPVSVVIFNHLSASVLTLLNWLQLLRAVGLIVYVGFLACSMMAKVV